MTGFKNKNELLENSTRNDLLNRLCNFLDEDIIKELYEIHNFDIDLLLREISKITNLNWKERKMVEITETISGYLIECGYEKNKELFGGEYGKQLLLENIRDIISSYQKLLGHNNTYRSSLYKNNSQTITQNTKTLVYKQIN